jgi:hypothetical protein
LLEFRKRREAELGSDEIIHRLFGPSDESDNRIDSDSAQMTKPFKPPGRNPDPCSGDLAQCFLRLAHLPSCPLDRLSRYEATLWRQATRTIFAIEALHRRKPWERRSRLRPHHREEWLAEVQKNV